MKNRTSSLAAVAIAASCALILGGCSTGYPSLAGVWKASDGSANKTISDDGNCTNMLYRDGDVAQVRQPGMCRFIASGAYGAYTLQVVQGPYSEKYTAHFSDGDKTLKLARGAKVFVTLTQTASAH